ncbi:MAG: 2Fe-2S iron-sulfur cluster-binding protein [Proteobacteria bacterium]|nr:2Fe-2S iron-sulfur cluster-binding protein [Pseudomonadota bacterium]
MTVKFTINGVPVEAEQGESVIEVARRYGFEIPSLCHHHAVTPYGACRVCLVEITKGGRKKMTTCCNYEVQEGIEVITDNEDIHRNRATVLELLLAEAPKAEAIVKLAAEYGVTHSRYALPEGSEPTEERDGCILCGLCVRVCEEVVEVSALSFNARGDKRNVGGPYMDTPQNCIACGACAWACPTNCIGFEEKDGMRILKKWNRELPLEYTEAGQPLAPRFQLRHFIEKANLPKDFYKKGGPR